MSRLANISGKDAVKAFQKAGWQIIGQVGSHVVLSKQGVRVIFQYLSIKNYQLAHFVPLFAILA